MPTEKQNTLAAALLEAQKAAEAPPTASPRCAPIPACATFPWRCGGLVSICSKATPT
jgi:hypothetical protein